MNTFSTCRSGAPTLLRTLVLTILVVPFARAQAPAVATPVNLPSTPLLPQQFGEWQSSGPAANVLNFDAPVASELQVRRSDAQNYTSGGATAVISAVQMTDSTGAYSAWTLKRTAAMRPCAEGNSLGSNCAVAAGRLLFWQGNTLVNIAISGNKPVAADVFTPLVNALPKPVGAKGAPPLLPTRLPQKGLLRDSLVYAVGRATYQAAGPTVPAEFIDFSKSPEISIARYAGSASGGTLTSIFYPTPTIAGAGQHALEKAIEDNALPSSLRNAVVRRSGPIVAFVSGLPKAEAAKLAEGVHYEAEITWNKPEGYMDQFTISRTSNVVVQIIILVLTVVFAALVLGVVFGGGRALIRKARGKPVSSLEDMEIIRLDLRGPAPKIRS